MTFSMTGSAGRTHDHFEPEAALDPQRQRQLRGHLEQIDYAAFAANREVVAKSLAQVDIAAVERLAAATAHARANWIAAALKMTKAGNMLEAEEAARLGDLRRAWEELSEVYEGLRRMIGRGYILFKTKP